MHITSLYEIARVRIFAALQILYGNISSFQRTPLRFNKLPTASLSSRHQKATKRTFDTLCSKAMCLGATRPITDPKRAIVVGAGPGGLLAAIHLLRRGDYHVTIVDPGRDYAAVDDLASHRSWMIGLANHGISAIREVPGLWDYVARIGVPLDAFSVYLGTKEMKQNLNDVPEEIKAGAEGYLVDRNYVVAALAKFIGDEFSVGTGRYQPRYGSRALYVDERQQRVLVRNEHSEEEEYLGYDLLIGADGIRSVVRNAILLNHRDFECRVDDIFNNFKAVHVRRPAAVGAGQMTVLPQSMPNLNGIALPEKGDMLCLTFGYQLHEPCDNELMSEDPKVVAKYVKEHFKAYELVDYDDFAEQWCSQNWNNTGQVHCNTYHSSKLSCLILGDAAHATSPSIGMGMNTALADASVLSRLIEEHGADNPKAFLPAFSEERVKEGQALTDLAFYLFSFNTRQQVRYLVEGGVRNFLHKFFPSYIHPDPQAAIGMGKKLSEVYDMSKKMGIIDSVHDTNDKVRRDYWEKRWGMVSNKDERMGTFGKVAVVSSILAASAGAIAANL